MKLFRKDSNYAVRTLVYISQQKQSEPISSTRVSETLGIPKNYLRRIFSKLISAGILNATEGARGGVSLASSPKQITVGDIILALQGQMIICNSTHEKKLCSNYEACVIRNRIMKIENMVRTEFHKITIQSLIDDLPASYST